MGHMKTIGAAVLLSARSVWAAPAAKPPPVPSPQARIDAGVERLLKQADVFWHDGDYDGVVFCYSLAVELDPRDVESWTTYGWFLWSAMSRREESRKVLSEAIRMNPDRWEVYAEMGNLQYHYRDFLGAAAWFAKAIGRGAPWTTWHQRAHSLEYAGRHRQCIETWRQIVEKFPKDEAAKLNLKRVKEGRFRKEPVMGVESKPGLKPVPEPAPNDLEPEGPQAPGSV